MNFDSIGFQDFIDRFARRNIALEEYEIASFEFFRFDFLFLGEFVV